MDPLEYLFLQRKQRYDIIDNITDRLAKIGEERRRKEFTQAAMEAIPDDGPVGYDVYTNLMQRFPNMDPQEAFQLVGGFAKAKTADRVKRVVRALQESKYDSDIEKKATSETLYRNNADIWGDVAEILKHGQAQYVERNPDRDLDRIDPYTGDRTTVKPARKQAVDLPDKWEAFYAEDLKNNPGAKMPDRLKRFNATQKSDTESDRNYEIYAQRLREQGKTPAPKDIWRAKATNPMEDYEAFANEDYGPKPEEPKKSGGNLMDKLRSALGGGETTEGDPLREQAIAELEKRGKEVNEATIRKTMLYLKGVR